MHRPSKSGGIHRRQLLAGAVALASTIAFPALARADYPEKPIKLVVPYTPGGATDVIARVVAQRLTVSLGQPVVVENKAGAAGNLGAAYVAREKPDGYTLMLGALTSHAINSVLLPASAGFTMDKSFAPVAVVGRVPLVVAVGPSFKGKTLADFIGTAKAKPGGLNYGSSGNGSPQHLAAELFKRQAGVDLTHVPYKGSSPALNDLMGGRLRALASATPQRVLPDVPTAGEAGLSGFEVSSMFGLLAPAGTPPPVIGKLSASLKDIMALPEVKAALIGQGVVPVYTTPDQARTQIDEEVGRWAKVIRESNIRAD